MKHLAAYLLLGLGGNSSPSAADVKKVLDSVGIEADDERLNTLISELEGKDINEVRSTQPTHSSMPGSHRELVLTRTRSSLPVPRSSPPSPLVALVALVVPLLAVLPLVVTPLPRRRRRRRLRSPTRTWASVSSTKRTVFARMASPFSKFVMAWFGGGFRRVL